MRRGGYQFMTRGWEAVLKILGRFLSGLNALAIGLGMIAVFMMILHITLDVSLRFLLNSPIPGTILFVSVFYMIIIVFMPVSAVEQDDGHISVELIYDMLSNRLRQILQFLSLGFSIIVFGALAVRTWQEAVSKYEIGSFTIEAGLWLPTWPTYFVLPIGFGLIILTLTYKIACLLLGRPVGLSQPVEATSVEAKVAEKLLRGGE